MALPAKARLKGSNDQLFLCFRLQISGLATRLRIFLLGSHVVLMNCLRVCNK